MGTPPPASSPRPSTHPAMAQETAKNSSVSRSSFSSPPKAVRASRAPAASFAGTAARKLSPGRNTAAA